VRIEDCEGRKTDSALGVADAKQAVVEPAADLTRSFPLTRLLGLPIYVAASQRAPFPDVVTGQRLGGE